MNEQDPFDFTRMSSNPPDNMNISAYDNPDNFIQPNNNNNVSIFYL